MNARIRYALYRSRLWPFINALRIFGRVNDLERRTQNRRHLAIDDLLDYLITNEVPGDYRSLGLSRRNFCVCL